MTLTEQTIPEFTAEAMTVEAAAIARELRVSGRMYYGLRCIANDYRFDVLPQTVTIAALQSRGLLAGGTSAADITSANITDRGRALLGLGAEATR